MADRAFLDTNILLYSISEDPQEIAKRDSARALMLGLPCALSVQVCQEFFHQATRPGGRFRLSADKAQRALTRFRHLPVQETTLSLFDSALAVQARTGYSIWDSLIVAAAQALGCNILYTEDMQDGRIIDGLRIVNPFRAGAILP
ncbi:PIN domain-containing protein [Sphingomonas sp. BIUV-7]|uniref:PIN domain-containing protein n=1 Tax=Sphingomonas natans TaxID=3063330 RepID=A0ABT8YEH4_9SPHN|nr:PIN domain-containing protein [Sphingomonas sp. BIUV-7]MDO6416754.1 PIN domain-containing protein [Sphingomonas sp. BIUV-7]